jgi:HAD superfamily hydrolase (TIGR01509 family)
VSAAATPRPPSDVEAVIFDLDGVLVDTEPVHLAATRALIAPAELKDEVYERFIGTGGFGQWLVANYDITDEEVHERYSGLVREALERAGLEPLDGVIELLEAIGERGIALAVASQSSRGTVETTLRTVGLVEYFPVITTAGEAGRDKPAPDVYLLAAERLGVTPAAGIAVEDSVHGIASASAAGLWVVQSTQASFTPPPQPRAGAVVGSLREFDLGWLGGSAAG